MTSTAPASASPARIVSFLPSATEMVCALGLSDRLVGVTHECDHPPFVRDLPVVIRPAIPLEGLSPLEVDRQVSSRLGKGESLYQADEELLRRLDPDLILTQDLCQVCAPSGNELSKVLKALPRSPKVLWQTPRTLEQIFDCLLELGEATGRTKEARDLVEAGRARLSRVRERVEGLPRPRVFMMEWVDPVYCAGHWVPEMVEIAGGEDRLGRKGEFSVRTPWEDVRRWAPEVLVLAPCSVPLREAVRQWEGLRGQEGIEQLPAFREGRTVAVASSAYFARPGPRVVEGVELLAHLFHPKEIPWSGPTDAYVRLDVRRAPPGTEARRQGSTLVQGSA